MTDTVATPEEASKANGHYLGQAWLILLLAVLYGGGLAGVQFALKDRIAANQLNETLDQIPQLVPGSSSGVNRSKELGGVVPEQVFQAIDAYGKGCGWVIKTSGQGFADRIEILVGVNKELDTITGIYVLAQKETPGLGDHISSTAFTDRLKSKPIDGKLKAVRGETSVANEFTAWTGATVSSLSVAKIINTGLERVKPVIGKLPVTVPQQEAAP